MPARNCAGRDRLCDLTVYGNDSSPAVHSICSGAEMPARASHAGRLTASTLFAVRLASGKQRGHFAARTLRLPSLLGAGCVIVARRGLQHVAVHIAMRTLIARRTQSRVLLPASTACPFIRSPVIITISPLGGTLRVITLFRLTLPRRLVAARLLPSRFRMAGR